MTPLSRFEIGRPSSVAEASQMLSHYGEEAAFYAGGTELLLAMRHGALRYRRVSVTGEPRAWSHTPTEHRAIVATCDARDAPLAAVELARR